jgi:hypothetical protein
MASDARGYWWQLMNLFVENIEVMVVPAFPVVPHASHRMLPRLGPDEGSLMRYPLAKVGWCL